MTAMSGVPVGPITQGALNIVASPQAVLSQKLNPAEDVAVVDAESGVENLEAKAAAIDAYFIAHGMPLAGTGKKMVIESEKNGLDWRLLAAISVRESTGGKHACKSAKAPNSFFGYGSCKFGFQSKDHAIEVVAKSLGGNNPKTAHYYANKTTLQILETYNPRTIVRYYPEQVIKIMYSIGDVSLGLKTTKTTDA